MNRFLRSKKCEDYSEGEIIKWDKREALRPLRSQNKVEFTFEGLFDDKRILLLQYVSTDSDFTAETNGDVRPGMRPYFLFEDSVNTRDVIQF